MSKSIITYRKEQAKSILSSNFKLLSEFLCLDIESMSELEFYTLLNEYTEKLSERKQKESCPVVPQKKDNWTLPLSLSLDKKHFEIKTLKLEGEFLTKRILKPYQILERPDSDRVVWQEILNGEANLSCRTYDMPIARAFDQPEDSMANDVVDFLLSDIESFAEIARIPYVVALLQHNKLFPLIHKNIELKNVPLNLRYEKKQRLNLIEQSIRDTFSSIFSSIDRMQVAHDLKASIRRKIISILKKKIKDRELNEVIENVYLSDDPKSILLIKKIETDLLIRSRFATAPIKQYRVLNKSVFSAFRRNTLNW